MIGLININVLEVKLGNYYQDSIQAFYQAENLLTQYEQQILNMTHKEDTHTENIKILDDSSICGVIFYQITAKTIFHKAQIELQSTLAMINNKINCEPKPVNITPGRQSFLIKM